MSRLSSRLTSLAVAAAVAALVALGLWRALKTHDVAYWDVKPPDVMGTQVKVTVVAAGGRRHILSKAVKAADAALRSVEAHMSTHLEDSEISRFNAAKPGVPVAVSAQTMEVLRASRDLAERTDGAFDVTCRPIVELWKKAAREDRPPAERQLAAALKLVGWDKITLGGGTLQKRAACGGVDLGGIAKGYGIDRAVAGMKQAGAAGGLVDVGGDIGCFGLRPGGGKWRIGIRNPFTKDRNDTIGWLRVSQGAVCTSGNYERYSTIRGRRYSHIVDPRTGRPVDRAPSVTVIAPTAMVADAWATALSVLGKEGLKLLPDGVEAMLVTGAPGDYRKIASDGFEQYVEKWS